jgi:hypothetical protein
MAFNINKFRSSFYGGEPASPTNYEVEIFRNPSLQVLNTLTGRMEPINLDVEGNLKYRCITCSLPGKMLTAIERNTYGPARKIATGALYTDVVFSFIIGDDAEELNYFHGWMNTISNNTSIADNPLHNVAYYDNYVTSTFITQFNKFGEVSRKIKLEESYPINIEAVPMGWEMSNDIMKVDVTMAYRNWITVQI